jgi:hypothetical protein
LIWDKASVVGFASVDASTWEFAGRAFSIGLGNTM